MKGMVRGGQLPLSHGGVEGGPPPRGTTAFLLCARQCARCAHAKMVLTAVKRYSLRIPCGISLPLLTYPILNVFYGLA